MRIFCHTLYILFYTKLIMICHVFDQLFLSKVYLVISGNELYWP